MTFRWPMVSAGILAFLISCLFLVSWKARNRKIAYSDTTIYWMCDEDRKNCFHKMVFHGDKESAVKLSRHYQLDWKNRERSFCCLVIAAVLGDEGSKNGVKASYWYEIPALRDGAEVQAGEEGDEEAPFFSAYRLWILSLLDGAMTNANEYASALHNQGADSKLFPTNMRCLLNDVKCVMEGRTAESRGNRSQ